MVELNKQFDVSGPLGFHITGHLLGLVALVVACFAITGYITFRDHSVPYKALDLVNDDIPADVVGPNKGGTGFSKTLVKANLVPKVKGDADYHVGTLPADTVIQNINMYFVVLPTGPATANLGYQVGIKTGGQELITFAGNNLFAAGTAAKKIGEKENTNIIENAAYSKAEREIWVRFTTEDTLTAAGEFVFHMPYLQC